MNEGQKKFFEFMLTAVKDDKKADAEALLQEAFAKQADGSFNTMYLLTNFAPKMLKMVKPEYMDKVKSVMENFAKSK